MELTINVHGKRTALTVAKMLVELAEAVEADRIERDIEWEAREARMLAKERAKDVAPLVPAEGTINAAGDGWVVSNATQAEVQQAKEQAEKKSQRGGRRYGQPSNGKARRTKEELAEDAEIEALANSLGMDVPGPDLIVAETLLDWRAKSAAKAEEPKANISANPEDREPPEEPKAVEGEVVDDLFDDAPAETYTIEQVREALGGVHKSFGGDMPKTIEWLKGVCGAAKTSQIAEADYGKVIAAAKKVAA